VFDVKKGDLFSSDAFVRLRGRREFEQAVIETAARIAKVGKTFGFEVAYLSSEAIRGKSSDRRATLPRASFSSLDRPLIEDALSAARVVLLSPLALRAGREPRLVYIPAEAIALGVGRVIKADKVLLFDPAGSFLDDQGHSIQSLSIARAKQVLVGQDKSISLSPESKERFRLLVNAVRAGVGRVTVLPWQLLLQEVFTTEGAGTMIFGDQYLHIEDPVAKNELGLIFSFITSGMQAGVIRKRRLDQFLALADHLVVLKMDDQVVGVAGLLPYVTGAEIVSLWTQSRLRNNGLARQLVAFLLEKAERQRFKYVFACTTSEGVRELFVGFGFQEVEPNKVPEKKWEGYPPDRHPWVLKKDL
jgi:N-acetylglutamate synthase-like GNAT family acetyltransferase